MGVSLEGAFQLTVPRYPQDPILGETSQPTQTIFEQSATQQYAVGTKLELNDGKVFRYAKNGGTLLAKGLMTSGEAAYARAIAETQSTYGTSAEIGDVELDLDVTTGGSWGENEFAGGMLWVESGTALGDVYRILANAINGSDDTLMRVRLETALRTAWAADSVVSLVKSKWQEVDVQATGFELPPAGVPLIAVTANYYCWLQTKGYCPMLVDTGEALVKGDVVTSGGTTAGACGTATALETEQIWGHVVVVVAAAGYALIDLNVDG